MRTLSATLLAAQRALSCARLAKIVLANNHTSVCSGGTPTASATTEGAVANLFDNEPTTGWGVTGAGPWWVKYDLGAGVTKTVLRYMLGADATEFDRMPTAWTFQGSNNDSDWTTLDTQTGITWLSNERKVYAITNATAYRYYKINMTATGEANLIRMADIAMFDEAVVTYTQTRILNIDEEANGPFSHKLTVVLNNSDAALTSLNFRGYDLTLSYGATTSAGDEYSACAPLSVVHQQQESSPGRVVVVLTAIGNGDQMNEDEAGEIYIPTLTETVKTILGGVVCASNAAYNHCVPYAVDWDSEDSLINSYIPKLNFIIGEGNSRQVDTDKLLELTKCVGLFKADGHFHVFVPTTTGVVYAFTYITGSGTHSVFNEEYRQKILKRNYITVSSLIGDVPQYSGVATDASYLIKRRDALIRMRLVSNAQATAVAEALIAKYQIGEEGGSVTVPLDCGAEIFDYGTVTNAQGTVRTGNIGWFHRKVDTRRALWQMTFGFGKWLGQQGLARALTNTTLGYKTADASITNIAMKKITEIGDTLLHSNDTAAYIVVTDYTKSREILIPTYGYLRIKFDLIGDAGEPSAIAYGKLYRNGTAIGTEQSEATGAWVTFSEDISGFKPGDLLQLWTKKAGSGSCQYRNFRLYHEVNQSQTGEFVNIL